MRKRIYGLPMSKARRAELASRTYVLHIVPERARSVSRTLEMLATQTLNELHMAVQVEFQLDYDQALGIRLCRDPDVGPAVACSVLIHGALSAKASLPPPPPAILGRPAACF